MTRKYTLDDLIENESNNLIISAANMEVRVELGSTLSSQYYRHEFQYGYYESSIIDSSRLYYLGYYNNHGELCNYLDYIKEDLEDNGKNHIVFLAAINPTLILNLLDTEDNIKKLLKGEKVNIDYNGIILTFDLY